MWPLNFTALNALKKWPGLQKVKVVFPIFFSFEILIAEAGEIEAFSVSLQTGGDTVDLSLVVHPLFTQFYTSQVFLPIKKL